MTLNTTPPASEERRAPPPIVQFGHPVLRMTAEPIERDKIASPHVQEVIDDMAGALALSGGIGLAAPQIALPWRLFIINIPAMSRAGYGSVPETPLTVVFNPVIAYRSEETRFAAEACLSIRTPDGRGVYEGVLERSERIVVQGYDREGREIEIAAASLLSRAMQHEIDHLDGVLFTDHIKRLRDLRIYYPIDRDDPVLERNTHLLPSAPDAL